jgi:glycosyltransferase involved in cell wall biosynthesis
MKVSVIIPAHNEARYIEGCIQSLMKQTVKADEIILINNNSTDKTVQIAKKFPIKIINEKKQGITLARNRGFNSAKYEIIARTDADTILPANWIKKIKTNFLNSDLVALSGPAEFYDLPELIQNSHWQSKATLLTLIKSYNKIVRKMTKHDCLYGPNYALRADVWKKVKRKVCLNDKKVHEDLDLAIHLSPYGKIKFDNSLIVDTSVRRWRKPEAYFEYLIRGLKSIQSHRKTGIRQKGEQIMKNFLSKTLQDTFPPSVDNKIRVLGKKFSATRLKTKSFLQKFDDL